MDCDDVFAILTRGPFPSGARHDRAVEAHLHVCPECQRLAEALRPSGEMLRESIDDGGSRNLPGYWGSPLRLPRDPAVTMREAVAPRRGIRTIGRLHGGATFSRSLNIWQITAAAAIGIVLGAAMRTLVNPQPGPAQSVVDARQSSDFDGVTITSNRSQAWRNESLNLLTLPWKCRYAAGPIGDPSHLEDDLLSPASRSSNHAEACCTQCHHSSRKLQLTSTAMRRLELSCRGCHN